MSDYKVIITAAGFKMLSEMLTGETIVLSQMGFGDAFGEPYEPESEQTTLKNELFRKDLSKREVEAGYIKYTAVITNSDPSGDIVELGLYTVDGTLFAVAKIPRLEHREVYSGAATETEVTLILTAENAENVTIVVPSSIYVSTDYANTYYLRTDGGNTVLSNISMNNYRLTNLAAGTSGSDAARRDQLMPIGSIILFGGSNTPSDYHDCDGAAYNRSGANSELYSVIGTTYGAGDGVYTFNVPSLAKPNAALPMRYIIKYK